VEEGVRGSFADKAVNPRAGLVAVHTCGNVGVRGGVWAFVTSRHKVRPDGICVAAGCLDSPVQRIGFDDPMAYML
jgi:hypothetical protein